MNIKKLLFISIFTFVSTAHSVEKATIDTGFGNSYEIGTHLFKYTEICGTKLDTDISEWRYTIRDAETRNDLNYVSFDVYKVANYTFTPEFSTVAIVSNSGASSANFICDQVPSASKIAVDNNENLYLIANHSENSISSNGLSIQSNGLKILRYSSAGNLVEESSATWEFLEGGGNAFDKTITFAQNGNLLIQTNVVFPSFYAQPFSFKFRPDSGTTTVTPFSYFIENKYLSTGAGSVLSLGSSTWFQNLTTSFYNIENRQTEYRSYIRKSFPTGELDQNFGHLGNFDVTPANSSFELASITLTKNENLIATGVSYNLDSPFEYQTSIVKTSQDGKIDQSFGINGYLNIPINSFNVPETDEYSSVYQFHKLLTTTSGFNILYALNVQDIESTYISEKNLIVFDSSGNIDDSLTQTLNETLNFDVFSFIIKIKQDDFGGLIFTGQCKIGRESWVPCIKRVNWDNKTESTPVIQSGSGSISILLIFVLLFLRRIKPQK